jgi:hypothetical protein
MDLWARLKPYNPKRGHLLRRCHYLGRLWQGGNGIDPGEIPEWVGVNHAQARELKKLRQDGTTHNSEARRAFDIVTEEQRKAIDLREEDYRKAALGLSRPAISELPDVSAPLVNPARAAQHKALTMEDLEDAPADADEDVNSVLTSEDEEDSMLGAVPGANRNPQVKAEEVDISGRQAAAEGFEAAGSHDLNDGEDVNDVAPQHGKAAGEAPEPTTMPPPRASRSSRSKAKSGADSRAE